MAVGTILFECGFVASVFWLRRAGWFLLAALGFHALTKITLSVFFWGNVACFPVAMRIGDWPERARRAVRAVRAAASRWRQSA